DPQKVAKELIAGTKLGDVEFRKKLAAEGGAEAETSGDSMIELVRSIDEEARKIRQRYEDEVEAVETAQGARIARARFAAFGEETYPDATFTLRMAFGTVKP